MDGDPMKRTRTIEWTDPQLAVAAAANRSGLEFLRAICDGTIASSRSARCSGSRSSPRRRASARFSGEPDESLYNPMGAVHGGWACTLLDSAMGSAVMTTVDRDTAYTTTQLSIYLTGPIDARTGRVTVEGRVVHRGGRVVTAEGRLTSERGRLLAHGTTSSCLLLPRAPKAA